MHSPQRTLLTLSLVAVAALAHAQAPSISSFKAAPAMIYSGKAADLSWTVTNATGLSISGIGTVTGTSLTVHPKATTIYTLTAAGPGGTATRSTRVVVKVASSIFPASSIARSGGGSKTVAVRSGGAWTAASKSPWITVTAGASGTGNGTVTLAVDPNPGVSPRTGTAKIRGQIYTVYQDGQNTLVHPRLWFDPSDIADLQKQAVPENTAYLVLMDIVAQAKQAYDTRFGTPNWKDNGIYTFSPETTEDYAVLFAFMSQIETDPTKKADYAARAKNMMMYIVNEAAKGTSVGAPFRDPLFGIKDRARFYGETFPLITDYIYPYLSASERNTIRNVLLLWNQESRGAYVGNNNNLMGMRASANNYQLAHFRNVIMRAEVMDPVDDPAVYPQYPITALGNSLHSYTAWAAGRWLSDLWTLFDHGDGRDGLPIEGTLYGLSYGWFHDGLLTLHKSAADDPQPGQPQLGMIDSPFWDQWLTGYLHLMVNTPMIPADAPYVGSVYEMLGYCDQIRVWNIPENAPMLASTILYDRSVGNTARADAEFWIMRNTLERASLWTTRMSNEYWFGNPPGQEATMQFAARNPFEASPADPRPALPKTFESQGVSMMIGRTNWDPTATTFSLKASYITENHTAADAGTFDIHRKGEMLTSAVRGYTGQDILNSTDYANTLGIQNDVPSDLFWFESQTSARGSQWILGVGQGDPKLLTSTGPGYMAADADLTKVYNRITNKSSVTDVKAATRTAIWLQPDFVVVYDRARTGKTGRFKRFNLQLTAGATVNGKVATAHTAAGQQLFVTSLLPAAGTLTIKPQEADGKAVGETMGCRLVVEDLSNPTDVRFLHVLQGADPAATRVKPSMLQSTSGAPFEGAVLKSFAVLFPHDPFTAANPFTSLVYSVKSNIATHYIAGLAPNGTYDVSRVTTTTGYQYTITPGSQVMADKAGVLMFKTANVGP